MLGGLEADHKVVTSIGYLYISANIIAYMYVPHTPNPIYTNAGNTLKYILLHNKPSPSSRTKPIPSLLQEQTHTNLPCWRFCDWRLFTEVIYPVPFTQHILSHAMHIMEKGIQNCKFLRLSIYRSIWLSCSRDSIHILPFNVPKVLRLDGLYSQTIPVRLHGR